MCESHLREGLAQIVWTGDCVCVLERKRTDMLNCDVVDSSLSLTKFIDTKITRAQVARISSSRWRVLAQFGFGSKEEGPRMTENLPFNSPAKAIRAKNHRAAQRVERACPLGKVTRHRVNYPRTQRVILRDCCRFVFPSNVCMPTCSHSWRIERRLCFQRFGESTVHSHSWTDT